MKRLDFDKIDSYDLTEEELYKLNKVHTNRQFNEIIEEAKGKIWKLTLIYPWFEKNIKDIPLAELGIFDNRKLWKQNK